MRKKLAVIGANEPLLPYYKRAKELGYIIYGFAWEEGAVCKTYCDVFFPISFVERDEILAKCQELKIDGITSFSLESALPTVIYVANNLRLETNSFECLDCIKDKYTMLKCFEKSGLHIPNFHLVSSTSDFASLNLTFPVIVKPVDNGGKRGVSLANNIDELNNAIVYATENSSEQKVLIESYIEGREYSVEYLSHGGIHYPITITEKINSGAPHFVELAHHQPAPISDEESERIKVTVGKALDSVKITTGASHTEVRIDKYGDVYIIELGPRMGGGFITSDLVPLSTGYDFTEGVIKLAVGGFEEPVMENHHFSGIYFLSGQTDYIKKFIKNHEVYKEIVKCELYTDNIIYAKKNSDRSGYFIYKSELGKFVI